MSNPLYIESCNACLRFPVHPSHCNLRCPDRVSKNPLLWTWMIPVRKLRIHPLNGFVRFSWIGICSQSFHATVWRGLSMSAGTIEYCSLCVSGTIATGKGWTCGPWTWHNSTGRPWLLLRMVGVWILNSWALHILTEGRTVLYRLTRRHLWLDLNIAIDKTVCFCIPTTGSSKSSCHTASF